MGFGFLVLKDGKRVQQFSAFRPAAPENSNNVAEYLAFSAMLDWFLAANLVNEAIVAKGDSQLVVNQMFGSWKIKRGAYVGEALLAKRKMTKFSALYGRWVPRRRNAEADALSRSGDQIGQSLRHRN